MFKLYDYVMDSGLTPEDAEVISRNIQSAMSELMLHNIYHYDLTTRNILYNPESRGIQIIDFEDQVRVYDEPDEISIEKMRQQLNAIKLFFKELTVDKEYIS